MTRREFVEDAAVAGLAFVACSIQGGSGGVEAQPRRREVVVNGKRVKTVDVHAHCQVPERMTLMGLKVTGQQTLPDVLLMSNAADRLRAMDEQGIDVEALSINAYWYKAEREVAQKIIAIQNEKLAEACAANPERFVAFASVALQFPDLAAEQLEQGVKKYNLRGAAIGGHVNGDELSAAKFDPFWKKAEELGCVVFMHPQGIPEMNKRLEGGGGLTNVIGNPLETTIFLSHLIFDGTLDRFPALKICSAHAGGYLPSYAGRSDYGCVRYPDACKGAKKHASEYLHQLYFDTIIFTPEGVRHLVAECGASQLMIGTDYPFPWSTTMVDQVLKTPGLSDSDKRAILGENAAKLLKI